MVGTATIATLAGPSMKVPPKRKGNLQCLCIGGKYYDPQ